jgi:formate-dependent nitrite reductase membrane component NrfD
MSRGPLYEWMVNYTPQTEWVEGKGVMFCLAFFFIQLGAGMFFVSSILGILLGEFIGWLICAILGGGLHLLHLGHPIRSYRMVLRPQTSWVSRGLSFVAAFLILGGVQMVFSFRGISSLALLVIANMFAFLTVIYGGFAMNCISGIPFWNSALLPILYAVAGFWGGAGLTMAVLLNSGLSIGALPEVEELSRALLVAFVVIFPTYLIAARYGLPAGKISVSEMVGGRLWPLFWIIVVFLGLVLPIGVVIYSLVVGLEETPFILLYLSITFELLGDLLLRYLILKNGFYNPLVSAPAYYFSTNSGGTS